MIRYNVITGLPTPSADDAWDDDTTTLCIAGTTPDADGNECSNVHAPASACEGQQVTIHNATPERATVYGLGTSTGVAGEATVAAGKGRDFFFSDGVWHAKQGYT